jgi:hypothetical protein
MAAALQGGLLRFFMFSVTTLQTIDQGNLQSLTEGGSSRQTGRVLFTPGLRPGTPVNVVFYLHGNMFSGFEALFSRVLASVGAAGKPLAFAMPSLESVPSVGSWIGTQARFDSFLDGVLLAAAEQINEQVSGKCLVDRDQQWNGSGPTGNRVAPATLGNLVIAAHSGGGFPMWTLVNNRSGKLSNLKELWFFDCLYGDMDTHWISWARANAGINLEIVYTVFPPKETSAKLARNIGRAAAGRPLIPNVRSVTQETSNDHNSVPPNNVGRLIRASTNL